MPHLPQQPVRVLVIGNPEAPELQNLEQRLPQGALLMGIGGSTGHKAQQRVQREQSSRSNPRPSSFAVLSVHTCTARTDCTPHTTGQTLRDFCHLSDADWASIEAVVKMGGGASTKAAVAAHQAQQTAQQHQQEQQQQEADEQQMQSDHSHLHRCNSSSVSLTLKLEVGV